MLKIGRNLPHLFVRVDLMSITAHQPINKTASEYEPESGHVKYQET